MFLGRATTTRTLEAIRANARALFQAVQLGDAAGLHRCVARSWRLNRALDEATSTPVIAALIDRCGKELAACKLVGAGGGGYMVLCARDEAAAQRIRARLEAEPPNPRARFIDFSVAEEGLQVTVS
jgi:galactokinase/mevalonate kinase-like predicted kinase